MIMLNIKDRLCRCLARPVFLSHTSNDILFAVHSYILRQAHCLRCHSADIECRP